jgi:amino acid adenylation domain-containing protein
MLIAAAESHGILLTMEQIFMNSSLEEMASVAKVREVNKGVGNDTLKPFALVQGNGSLQDTLQAITGQYNLRVNQIENVYPCSPMQESLVAEFDGNTNPYVRQFVFYLADDVPLDRLQRAWDDTIRANPVLRTRICNVQGTRGYMQTVVSEVPIWYVREISLSRFLQEDEQLPMVAGDHFFRYTIVIDDDKRHFVWTAHHALCDGASIPEVLEEVAIRFQGKSASIEPRAPFETFIQLITGLDIEQEQRQELFWRQSIEDLNPVPFPPLPQLPEFQVHPSATIEHSLRLTQEQAPRGVSKALLLRAAWAILLAHYSGTQDIVFGAINNGRAAPVSGVSRMTGPTINLVPIALRVDPEQSVAAFLSSVWALSMEMIPFEHMGMSKIRQSLAHRMSAVADFQTLFVVHAMEFANAIAPSMKSLGLQYVDSLGKKEHHPYPLVITCAFTSNTTVKMIIQHDDRVVSARQAENLGHQFEAVLTQLNESSGDSLLASVSPLSTHDLAQIQEWNRFTPPPEETCIHHLFSRQLQAQPGATAVCSLEQTLTYAEVDKYSTSLSLQLIEHGVQPGSFVAVCYGKSIWTLAAILAVFKAGGIYVPIEPAHPRGRIAEIIASVGIKVGLASLDSAGTLEGLCDDIVTVNGRLPQTNQDLQPPSGLSQPSSIAYLLFTSGSTGKPKGILVSHQAICSSIVHHGRAFAAGPHWRTMQFGAHTFDLSISEFFTTLAFGGCICVPSEEDRLNNLAGAVTALNANTLLVVPTVANLLHPKDVPTLKNIVLAGEPITKQTIVRWADHVELTAAYGPSETAVYCSGNLRVSPDADPSHIGRAIGATMWISNPENYHQLCAIGCTGEILISGPLLGTGYTGDKAQTDAAWIPAPEWMKQLSSNEYQMLYRSGDLARYNDDGTFRIVGRRDTQVKLRGYRIELGEIENQLMVSGIVAAVLAALPRQGPCIRQIVAVLSFNRPGLHRKSSVSGFQHKFVLGTDRHSPDTRGRLEQLQRRLGLALPEYMVPTIWILLEELPVLISGKIDRKALKGWIETMSKETFQDILGQQSDHDRQRSQVIPGSLADKLRQLWCNALRKPAENVDLHTSFFAIGGDSIAAIEVVSQGKRLGLPLTVRTIINAKTLGNLVALVEQQLIDDDNTETLSMDLDRYQRSTEDVLVPYAHLLQARLHSQPSSVMVEDAYHFSSMQREIQRQRQANSAVFLLSWHMEFASQTQEKAVSLERLAMAWKRVVQRFPILRSIFVTDPTGQLPSIQIVLGNVEPEIATASVSLAAGGCMEPSFETLGIPPVDECFLPHRTLISQRGDKFFMHIELDHLVIDGWSLRVIKEALLEAYEAGDARYLPPQAPSYKDFVTAQLRPDREEEDRKYWASMLREQPQVLLSFPAATASSALYPSPLKTIIYLPQIPAAALTSFSVAHGLTPASIFDAAWAQTLSLYTQQSSVGFEYVVSGRDEDIPGVFDMVGPLINVLAYHVRGVTAGATTTETELAHLAKQLQDQRAQDSLHSAVNIRDVMAELHNGNIFNTAMNFQRRPTTVESPTLWVDDDIRRSNNPSHVSSRSYYI